MKKIILYTISISILFACYQAPKYTDTELENAGDLNQVFMSISDKVQDIRTNFENFALGAVQIDQDFNPDNIPDALREIPNGNNTAENLDQSLQDLQKKVKNGRSNPETIKKVELLASKSQALLQKAPSPEKAGEQIKKLMETNIAPLKTKKVKAPKIRKAKVAPQKIKVKGSKKAGLKGKETNPAASELATKKLTATEEITSQTR